MCVVQETFPVVGWQCESYSLHNGDSGEVLDVRPCFFSNAGEVEGSLYWITPRQIDSLREGEVKDRLCMVNVATETGKVFGRNAIAEHLDALGAATAIFVSEQNGDVKTSPKITQTSFTVSCVVSGEPFFFPMSPPFFFVWL